MSVVYLLSLRVAPNCAIVKRRSQVQTWPLTTSGHPPEVVTWHRAGNEPQWDLKGVGPAAEEALGLPWSSLLEFGHQGLHPWALQNYSAHRNLEIEEIHKPGLIKKKKQTEPLSSTDQNRRNRRLVRNQAVMERKRPTVSLGSGALVCLLGQEGHGASQSFCNATGESSWSCASN